MLSRFRSSLPSLCRWCAIRCRRDIAHITTTGQAVKRGKVRSLSCAAAVSRDVLSRNRRAVTAMVYLNDVDAGGHTYFPRARPVAEELGDAERPAGIRIQPRKGRALIFWNIRQGREDEASLHEAQPVLGGTKLVATKWLSTTPAVPPDT